MLNLYCEVLTRIQYQQTDQPMAEMLLSIKEPMATAYELMIEAKFQVFSLSPGHSYSHHTFCQIIACGSPVWIIYCLDLKGMCRIQGK